MKQIKTKVLLILVLGLAINLTIHAQRGVRIAYIDTEYILENVPEYAEAETQLASKVNKWKGEIETKRNAITQKRKDLDNEKALLTKELIDEREEDIFYEEKELLDYQQDRFGPEGDLMIQKRNLIQPVQDQIFAAVQDMAEKRKYDFVFDKSADVVMLYSAERYDISEDVLRSITRSAKRTQASSKAERKAAKDEELVPEINKDQEAREKALEAKREERVNAAEQRKADILAAREAKKVAATQRRDSILAARQKIKDANAKRTSATDKETGSETEDKEDSTKTREELLEERRLQKLADREARKKELEERRQQILEDRKKAQEEREKSNDEN